MVYIIISISIIFEPIKPKSCYGTSQLNNPREKFGKIGEKLEKGTKKREEEIRK